ncbi:hypothetical protein [Actinophytocola sp.]|jgi:hypothetical protein|uniref:hypothetical protein n=1 Tax=Actinophytocola sp. TaxID=1872138 RepID=UPI002ED7FDE9
MLTLNSLSCDYFAGKVGPDGLDDEEATTPHGTLEMEYRTAALCEIWLENARGYPDLPVILGAAPAGWCSTRDTPF